MAALQICFLLVGLLALTSFVSMATINDDNTTKELLTFDSASEDDLSLISDSIDDDDDDDDDEDDHEDDDGLDPDTTLQGIPIKYLTQDEINEIADEIDQKDEADLDLLVAHKTALQRTDDSLTSQGSRKKRAFFGGIARGLIWAGRALFRSSRVNKVTSSGSRVTRHYHKKGSYRDAQNDFNRFKPDHMKPLNGKTEGYTGTVGKHRMTVRKNSSEGNPTLEIRSQRQNGNTFVRKFRYNRNK